jgi:2-C-methyl-D-erythritol 4-phosphate cytidylyltransferase
VEADRCVAVVLAGGVGKRVRLETPKQLLKIAGRPIIEHTLNTLHRCDAVDEIVVMMAPGYLDPVRAIVDRNSFHKVTHILEGGLTRNDTTRRSLDALSGDRTKVILHDAVRPLVSDRVLEDCVEALDRFDAVDTAIMSADTLIEVDAADVITDIPPRSRMRRGQTPQGFRLGVLRRAYELAAADPDFSATDDCTVVLRYCPSVSIGVVPGEERNLKVTDPIDVYIADKLFQLSSHEVPDPISDQDMRERLEGKTVVVFGGSYGIGAEIARLAEAYGADVHVFSRSGTRTHVERRADLVDAAARVIASSGRLDYVVNTAGILPRGDLVSTSDEDLYQAIEVNYLAPILIAQQFYPHLAQTRGGLLLFTSSSYTRGRGGYSLYSSAKAAVVNLTQALADEWSAGQVRVNCINPERTATPMRTRAFGAEPPETLLTSDVVATASLRVLVSGLTGHVVDIRREDPLSSHAAAASAAAAETAGGDDSVEGA